LPQLAEKVPAAVAAVKTAILTNTWSELEYNSDVLGHWPAVYNAWFQASAAK